MAGSDDNAEKSSNGKPPIKRESDGSRFQVCQKCGATFTWERTNPELKTDSPLIARLSKPSDDCDCGYGAIRVGGQGD